MNWFRALESATTDAASFWSSSGMRGVAIWILAFVFVLGGIVKLRRPALAAMAIVDFGVLKQVRPGAGTILGAFELSLGLILVLRVQSVVALLVAAGLLWIFVFLIARAQLSGADFACFCFGEANSVLSRGTLARSLSLALLASAALTLEMTTQVASQQPSEFLIELVAAAVFLGVGALIVQIPVLLRWNSWVADHRGAANS